MEANENADELIVEYELSHINYIAEEKIIKSDNFRVKYHPWMQKSISPLKLSMPNSSGLSKLTFKLKTLDNQILHRNFMHFEVNSNKKLKNVEVFSLPPKEISNSN